jgi:MSHA biogenesis protein MshP
MRTPDITRRLRQTGFGLVSAIFLVVVLALLGTAMVAISTTQQQSSALDIEGVRAYQAAKAGIEWGLYQRLQLGVCTGANANVPLPPGTSLSGFTVTVVCRPDTFLGNTAVITATACNIPAGGSCPNNAPNNGGYVERVMEVRL